MMKINEFVNQRRKELNMSVDELVKKSGIPKGTLSKITAGINTNPTLSTVEALCKALNCSLNDIVGNVQVESFSFDEKNIIKKYRQLDAHGKDIIDTILDKEYERCREQSEKSTQIPQQIKNGKMLTEKIAAFGGNNSERQISEDELRKRFEDLRNEK